MNCFLLKRFSLHIYALAQKAQHVCASRHADTHKLYGAHKRVLDDPQDKRALLEQSSTTERLNKLQKELRHILNLSGKAQAIRHRPCQKA